MLRDQTQMADSNLDDKKVDIGGSMITKVPFMLYKVSHPNMRTINEDYRKLMPYSNWTETKNFESAQIQEVIATEYPDNGWTIDWFNKEFLMTDINNTFANTLDEDKMGFEIELLVKYSFERENPPAA